MMKKEVSKVVENVIDKFFSMLGDDVLNIIRHHADAELTSRYAQDCLNEEDEEHG